jgi:PAS domain S-box-containing protein
MARQDSVGGWTVVLARLTAGLTLLLTFTVLVGWHIHSPFLIRWFPSSAAMQYNTTLALLLTAVALLACSLGRPRWVLCAVLPILYGLAAMFQDLLELDLGIDQVLFRSPLPGKTPGRMAAVTAACLILLDGSLLLLRRGGKSRTRSLVAALVSSSVIALSAVVFLCGLTGRELTREFFFSMAPVTAVGLALLGLGILALAWREGTAAEERVPAWLPVPVGFAVATIAVVLWEGVQCEQDFYLNYSTRMAAQRARDRISATLQKRSSALGKLISNWLKQQLPDEDAFQQEIEKQHLASLRFVQFLAPSHRIRATVPRGAPGLEWRKAAIPPALEAALEAARNRCKPLYSPFVRLNEGKGPGSAEGGTPFAVAVVIPHFRQDQFTGWYVGTFNGPELLGSLVADSFLPGFGIAISQGEDELYHRDADQAPNRRSVIMEERVETESLSLQVKVWPTPETIAAHRSPLPAVILGGGLLLALLLSGAVHLAQVAWLRARQAKEAARKLEEDLAERRRVEEARRQSEFRFRAVFNQTFGLIGLVRPDGTILEVNQTALDVRGLQADEVLGRLAWDTLGLEAPAGARANIRAAIAHAATGKLIRREVTLLDARQVPRTFDFSLKPVLNEAGTVSLLIAEARDVTEQKQLAEQLRQAQKMEAVGKLAGGVAHDFNNLLTIITGYSEVLQASLPQADPLRPPVEAIAQAAQRAADLTRQLLAFGRKQMLTPRPFDLVPVIRETETLLRRLLGEDIELTVVLASGVGRIFADPSQIQQVLLNLAINARDAMPQGGTLTIAMTQVELDEDHARTHVEVRPGPYVQVAISDTGCGMDEKTQARIFEPFFTTKEVGKGTGLGLAIVYGVVKQSEGHIEVESAPEQGATFRLYFPLVEEAESSGEGGTSAPSWLGGTETVLLVEDDLGVCAVARLFLGRGGYNVLTAGGPEEALVLSQQYPSAIHLLIADVVMPQMNGRQLADRLAQSRPEMKVLFVSGYSDDAVLRHGLLTDQVALLQKPFTQSRLLERVREVLGPISANLRGSLDRSGCL